MDSATGWLYRVTGRKKGYVVVFALVQATQGGLGVLFALLLRNVVDSAVAGNQDAFWQNVLLDESTSALDEATERRLLENLRALTDKTVVIVTHRKAALSICDRVLHFTELGVEEV